MTTPDLSGAVWRKSSRSSGNNGNCVELACRPALRGIRDSKNPAAGILVFGQGAADRFVSAVKAGRFDG